MLLQVETEDRTACQSYAVPVLVSVRSLFAASNQTLDKGADFRYALLERQLAGIEFDSILRPPQRCGGAAAVVLIPLYYIRQNLFVADVLSLLPKLQAAPLGAPLRAGREEDLELRIRQDYCTDVAPGP